MPIIIPALDRGSELEAFAQKAIEAKELTFKRAQPSKELIDFCQMLAAKQKSAPEYLRLPKQLKLITTADDCLNIIELAVHWAVEKLYGVRRLRAV
jgi:hypothetical protein